MDLRIITLHFRRSLSRAATTFCVGSLSCLAIVGCAENETESVTADAPPVLRAEPSSEPEIILPSQLRRMLKANENAKFERLGNDIVSAALFESGVKSIEPLKGLPLRSLDLGMCEVSDLSPLKGMPLTSLILENTPVDDISVVKGMQLEVLYLQNTNVTDLSAILDMPIRELNLMNVPVSDLSAVANLPLQTLWVPGTKVTDISALKGKPMVSLDFQGTAVDSIAALEGMATLERLNISQTPVKDVSPLKGLTRLQRITLTPENIDTGLEVLRELPALTEILTSMEGPRQSAAEFWAKYDAGVWEKDTPKEKSADDVQPNEKKGAAGQKASSEKASTGKPEASKSADSNK